MKIIFIIIALGAFLSSCHKDQSVLTDEYYDFAGYFSEEINHLKNDSTLTLSKMVTLNKVTEQKSLIKPDWNQELAVFKKINIKPAVWKNSYRLDSFVKIDKQLTTLHYSTADPKMEIHRIEITDTMDFSGGQPNYKQLMSPNKLIFHLKVKNALTSSLKILAWLPNKGFVITGSQKTKVFDTANYRIQGIWRWKP